MQPIDLHRHGTSALAGWNARVGKSANVRTADTTAPDGAGITTAQLSNPNASAINAGVNPAAPPWAQPVTAWLAIVGLAVAYKYIEEHPNSGIEKANLFKLSVGNTAKTTIMAVVGISLGKWILGYWRVPGLSDLWLAT